MKSTAPFIAVSVVVLAVFGYFLLRPTASNKLVMATIYLTPYEPTPGTRACAATTVPYTLQVQRNDDVEWSVVDFCGITQNYTIPTGARNWEAVEGSTRRCGGSSVPVENERTDRRNYKAKVKANCETGARFKYQIYVGDTMIADPELEIA
jgi:hypothetical protein